MGAAVIVAKNIVLPCGCHVRRPGCRHAKSSIIRGLFPPASCKHTPRNESKKNARAGLSPPAPVDWIPLVRKNSPQTALEQFQRGDLAGAESTCRQLLMASPKETELLNLLGVILGQKGELRDSINLLNQAIALKPGQSSYYANLGLSLLRANQSDAAEAQFRKALEIDPHSPRLHVLLANTLRNARKLDQALRSAEEAAHLAPGDASARYTLGILHEEMGNLVASVAAYVEALKLQPAFPEAHNNLGGVLKAMGRHDMAIKAFESAIRYQPAFAAAYSNLGTTLQDSGDLAGAIVALRQAVALSPRSAEIQNNLGFALLKNGEHGEAAKHLRAAIELNPDLAQAHNNLGTCLYETGEKAQAVDCFETALRKRPGYAEAFSNLGLVRFEEGDYAAAHAFYTKALEANPASDTAHFDMGSILGYLDKLDNEIAAYRRALDRNPQLAKARKNMAYALIKKGEWDEAWREYGWRVTSALHPLGPKRGNGELPGVDLRSVAGKRVIIHSEQGLGDIVFFMRFAPLLKEAGAQLVYCGEPRLAAMLLRTGLFDASLGPNDGLPADAVQILVGDLPYLCGCVSPELAPPPLTLVPDAERKTKMQALLSAFGPPPYFGLTWRAGVESAKEQYKILFKTVALSDIAGALSGAEATFVSLQRAPKAAEQQELSSLLGRPVLDLSAVNDDLEDMLGLVSCLDEYIGVSNTNIHLRAGVSRRAKVLVPWLAEWRWVLDGNPSSPWFPGFEVYRQKPDGDWSAALTDLRNDIQRQSTHRKGT